MNYRMNGGNGKRLTKRRDKHLVYYRVDATECHPARIEVTSTLTVDCSLLLKHLCLLCLRVSVLCTVMKIKVSVAEFIGRADDEFQDQCWESEA